METDMAQMPFVKQLAAGDRPTREKALTSLQTYLCSGRTFTWIELLKIWKGLFFCMHHTDRPAPQATLARSLSSLLLALPTHLFLPYLAAFWFTMISYYSDIPSLRLDKYLYLIRLYVASSFSYLARHGWNKNLLDGWRDLMEGVGDEWTDKRASILDVSDGKVPDGLRYHVLDVWVDTLLECEDSENKGLLEPVQLVAKEGKTKILRTRAKGVLEDERLLQSQTSDENEAAGADKEDFEGFNE